jgi:anti-anti-sigma factor
MNIVVSVEQGKMPVTVMRLEGHLDGQNYQNLIAKARELYEAGARNILLDLDELTYISSAGIVALHSIALMLRGESAPDLEQGWTAVKAAERTREAGIQKNIKFLNIGPDVYNVLDMVGLAVFFENFTDRETALRSF